MRIFVLSTCAKTVALFFFMGHLNVCAASVSWPAMSLTSYGTVDGVYRCQLTSVLPSYSVAVLFEITRNSVLWFTLSGRSLWAADGILMYMAGNGDAVMAASCLAATPLVDGPRSGSTQITLNRVYYLAFWMGMDIGGEKSAYGWTSLKWDGTKMTLLDSAAETTGVGLYVGTHTAIPEPSAAALLLVGAAALAGARGRRGVGRDNNPDSRGARRDCYPDLRTHI